MEIVCDLQLGHFFDRELAFKKSRRGFNMNSPGLKAGVMNLQYKIGASTIV
jgi:hypothetical protein